jgi:hypothetical protein
LAGREGESLTLDIELAREAVLEGRVEPHATVVLDSLTARGLTRRVHADGSGAYAFHGLPAGDYELSYHSGRAPAAAPHPRPKTPLTLAPGERRQVSPEH